MQMHPSTQNNYVSLDKQFQQHLSKYHHKNGIIGQVKYKTRASEIKWADIEYHVQYNADVAHKDVKYYCNKNKLPALPFFGPHSKPHGARGVE